VFWYSYWNGCILESTPQDMSDFILEIFPQDEITTGKVHLVEEELKKERFISSDNSGDGYLPGPNFLDYFEFENEDYVRTVYKDQVRIIINEKGYAALPGEEDFEYVDKMNVVEIWNADGHYIGWSKLCALLEKITGDKYQGEFEIL
jgi:hypothetical protein